MSRVYTLTNKESVAEYSISRQLTVNDECGTDPSDELRAIVALVPDAAWRR